ncbi:MAG TPA: S8 family serine peptidase, partial [candidate division Zixibacteria bacterium]|nr:S8 family serine peptidase [candidate division Zixibacteria bacterium]
VVELRPAVRYTRHEEDLQADESLYRSPGAVADLLNYGSSAAQLLQINAHVGHERGYNGSGVTIAMFDTGYRTSHQAFAALINDGRLLGQWDFVNNDGITDNQIGDPSSAWSHGTLTWSAAGGQVDGALYGPAYGANFLLAKTENVSSETIQEEYDWVSALEWADSLGADVVSSSLAYSDWYQQSDFDGSTAVTTLAANMATSLGIVVCNAAANSGPGPSTLNAPADAFDILACGAVDASGFIAAFSSRGPTADGRIKPDVCARGVGTFCGGANGDTYYTTASGTSLSTPLVAGAVAQLIQARPTFPPTLIMRALRETASQNFAPNNDYGWGIINLEAALDWGVRFEALNSSADLIVVDHPATVDFSDVSDLTGSAWSWNFGDGGSSTQQNPSHQYASPGTYSVDLTLETAYGSFDRVKPNLIVVRAGTISVKSDSAYAGQTLAVRVELT